MSKSLAHEILDDIALTSELFRSEKSFRETVRHELLECDLETVLSEAQWFDDFSILNMVASIVRDEAMKILWSKYGKSIEA